MTRFTSWCPHLGIYGKTVLGQGNKFVILLSSNLD